jgi:hypothetical protein
MNPEQLEKQLRELGWIIAPSISGGFHNTGIQWYAYKKLEGANHCIFNEMEPSLIMVPYHIRIGADVLLSVEFSIFGELADGTWIDMKARSISMDKAIEFIPRASEILKASWNAASSIHIDVPFS